MRKSRFVMVLAVVALTLFAAVPAFAQGTTPPPVMTETSKDLLDSSLVFIGAAGVGVVIAAYAVIAIFGAIMRKLKGAVR